MNGIYETDFVDFSYGFRQDAASMTRWTLYLGLMRESERV